MAPAVGPPRLSAARIGGWNSRRLDPRRPKGRWHDLVIGFTDKAIADHLVISPKTASVHVANIKGKLGASSRVEIALSARELGLLDHDTMT